MGVAVGGIEECLWLRLFTGQLATVAAAPEAGVDRTTVMTLPKVAKDGAMVALQASAGRYPGRIALGKRG